MAKMDELYNEMYDYCEENNCWKQLYTAREWNECLQRNYGSASFTALARLGKIERFEGYKNHPSQYRIVPTGEIKKKMAEAKVQQEREYAEWVVNRYDDVIRRANASYEEAIRSAEEKLACDIAWETERLEKAKALLNEITPLP